MAKSERKLKLRVDELRVESFAAAAERMEGEGTVFAQAAPPTITLNCGCGGSSYPYQCIPCTEARTCWCQ